MKSANTTARPSVDLDATDELPVLDPVAYEAELRSREPAGPAAGGATDGGATDSGTTATESDRSAADALAPDEHVASAASHLGDSDVMSAVEHWIVQKTEELRAHHDALSLATREQTAAVARADALSRELAVAKSSLGALDSRALALAEELTRERETAQRRAAELDAARSEAAGLARELADARTAETQHNAALTASAALLEQRSGELQALQ